MHRTRSISWMAAFLPALLCPGCPARPHEPLRAEAVIRVRVTDTGGGPVEGAMARVGADDVSHTDRDGLAMLRIAGWSGEVRRVTVTCPQDSLLRKGGDAAWVLGGDARHDAGLMTLEHEAICIPAWIELPLVVRTRNTRDVPVLLSGQEVARTDQDGVAQVLLRAKAGESISVVLDTSASPSLRPRSPVHMFAVTEADGLWMIDQVFATRAAKVKKKRPKPHAPSRL